MKLYELSKDIATLLDSIEDDGEIPPDLERQLDALQLDFEQKVEDCCAAVRNLEAEAAALKDEADRFARRAQTAARAAERLKDFVHAHLVALNITKMDAGLFKVSVRVNPPAVVFDGNPETLADKYRKVSYALDRRAALEAWKEREPLPEGVRVVTNCHLRIS